MARFDKSPAANERFCVIATVSPQIMQCKLASYYPAASSVEAATTQSRHHVGCKCSGQRNRTRQDTREAVRAGSKIKNC